jgi:hypothetical protein
MATTPAITKHPDITHSPSSMMSVVAGLDKRRHTILVTPLGANAVICRLRENNPAFITSAALQQSLSERTRRNHGNADTDPPRPGDSPH